MASVYRKKTGIYYISVMFQNNRITRSLGTRSYQSARKVISQVEKKILSDILEGKQKREKKKLSFPQLMKQYVEYPNHNWTTQTKMLYSHLLNKHLTAGLPDNLTTRAMTIRTVNSCNNWGYKHGYIDKPVRLQGGNKWESRHRVINDNELEILFNGITDTKFNLFVRFAYYTGARSGEIRHISMENLFSDYLVTYGKTGKRIIKLNNQAQEILKQLNELWDYKKDFVSHKFKKEARRLGIPDIRFHELRRSFGYNLIKQGRPIYEVSKLLGHSSVTTTERHYAPLLTTEIDDFVL